MRDQMFERESLKRPLLFSAEQVCHLDERFRFPLHQKQVKYLSAFRI